MATKKTTKKTEEEVVETVEETTIPEKTEEQDFVVRDPEILRPAELPLVIEAPKGGWANAAQESYAQTLNAYAYKNPQKWNLKKGGLLAQLRALATNPGLIALYQGGDPEAQRLKYKNHIIDPNNN